MRILIVTAWYAPLTHPRPHRWTALAAHWATQEHEVHVLTTQQRGLKGTKTESGVTVHRVGFDALKSLFFRYVSDQQERNRPDHRPAPPSLLMRWLMGLYRLIWQRLYFPDDAIIWYRPARKKLLQLLDNQAFDVVVSVSYPFTGHLLGWMAKQHQPHLKWIADMGDPLTSIEPPINHWRSKSRHWERRVLESADATTVTTEATKRLFTNTYGQESVARTHVIGPLLHPLPETVQNDSSKDDSVLQIGYFGTMYAGVRPPDALLTMMQLIPADKSFSVHIFGDLPPEYIELLSKNAQIILHGLIDRARVPSAMQQMDVLVHIGNATPHQLPSKAADYLVSGKPVVHLARCDNDAFTLFWPDARRLCTLKFSDRTYSPTDRQRLLDFLEHLPNEGNRTEYVRQFSVEAIGKAYEDLM
jgi:glycosyltransferase involved in cell wall biosynthesis